jgi:hypothetical protein
MIKSGLKTNNTAKYAGALIYISPYADHRGPEAPVDPTTALSGPGAEPVSWHAF